MGLFWGNDQLYDIYQNKLDFNVQENGYGSFMNSTVHFDWSSTFGHPLLFSRLQNYDSSPAVEAAITAWNNVIENQDFSLFDDASSYTDLCTEVEAVQDKYDLTQCPCRSYCGIVCHQCC